MRTSEEYEMQERQLVSIDCAIFGYHEGELKLLLFHREKEPMIGHWSLVGGWVNGNESVDDAAQRVLQRITGLNHIFMEQVSVFSDPQRDSGGRVISVLFYSLIVLNEQTMALSNEFNAQWCSVNDLPQLIFDHNQMVDQALAKLQQKASYSLIGRELLPQNFTITQLRSLYDSIFNRTFDPGNFRKKVLSLGVLQRLDTKDNSESRKGAYYYCFNNNIIPELSGNIIKL
ncbi:MAG: NUDIX hydrolase [Salinivirgaceae bacterium]|nr:NUDIX hydrolase [Salinivirgaceae bacterium]